MRDETLARLAADTIALLERDGACAFDRFSLAGTRPRRHTRQPYQGGNALALWATAEVKGYASPFWMTFKQALEYGGMVRKGERSTVVMYWDRFKDKDDPDARGGMFAKAYPVFNASQIDGLDATWFPAAKRNDGFPGDATLDAFVAATGAMVREGQTRACYVPDLDLITMPGRDRFTDAGAFYATLLHELIHWTGATKRLDRLTKARFASPEYAMEELVAEIGSAMLCGDLGMSKEPRPDHAHYLKSWLKGLKSDPKLLWTAGSAADKAAQFLHDMQPKAAEQHEPLAA